MRLFVSALVALLICGPASADESWTVGLRTDHSPYSYQSVDGALAGVDVELISAVLAKIDVKPAFRLLEEAEREEHLRAGALDMLAQVRGRPTRFENWDMLGPYRMRRVVLVGGPYNHRDWTEISDFTGKTIGIVEGRKYGPLFERALEIETKKFDSLVAAVEAIGFTIHHMVGAEMAVLHAIRSSSVAGELRLLPKPIDVTPLYIAFPQSPTTLSSDPADTPKVERFRSALRAVRASGRFDAILSRWRNQHGATIQ